MSARGVSKRFGDQLVLDAIDLEIAPGAVYGLLGPNGAGKTTLIRILTTLLPPTSGTATIDGLDVVAQPKAVRQRIGLAGQFAAVDGHLTGRENLEMVGRLYNLGRTEARRRAGEVLDRIHLDEAADRLVRTYSGGMRRRLDLAASMVGRPQVLFLDEPTTGVDPRSRLDIWDLIVEMVADGTTLLLTTQYLDEAERLADRIGVIDRGHLVAEGTPDELKRDLRGDRIEVTVDPVDLATARASLTVGSGAPSVDERRSTLLVAAPNGADDLRAVLRRLEDAAVRPIDIGLRRPSLDEVFFALTGDRSPEERPSVSTPGVRA